MASRISMKRIARGSSEEKFVYADVKDTFE